LMTQLGVVAQENALKSLYRVGSKSAAFSLVEDMLIETQGDPSFWSSDETQRAIKLMKLKPAPKPFAAIRVVETIIKNNIHQVRGAQRLTHHREIILHLNAGKGSTTTALAAALARHKDGEAVVLAIDHWPKGEGVHIWPEEYSEFLKNVASHNLEGEVVPLPISGSLEAAASAAAGLTENNWLPDMIYISKPKRDEQWQAMQPFWELLKCNGTLAGDGYELPVVMQGVDGLDPKTFQMVNRGWIHAAGTMWERWALGPNDTFNVSSPNALSGRNPAMWQAKKLCP